MTGMGMGFFLKKGSCRFIAVEISRRMDSMAISIM
jgi:hypothetical protein